MSDLIVSTPAFEHDGLIPVDNTGYGADMSPEFQLQNIDERAKTIAIIMDDMDHPIFPAYNHWVIWNIPVMQVIPANIPCGKIVEGLAGAVQGRGYGKYRYRGPNIYTLDCTLELSDSSRKRELLEALNEHVLQHGVLIGYYR